MPTCRLRRVQSACFEIVVFHFTGLLTRMHARDPPTLDRLLADYSKHTPVGILQISSPIVSWCWHQHVVHVQGIL